MPHCPSPAKRERVAEGRVRVMPSAKRRMGGERIGSVPQSGIPILIEFVVFLHFAAERQAPAMRRNLFDVAAELDFGFELLVARAAVSLALIRETNGMNAHSAPRSRIGWVEAGGRGGGSSREAGRR